MENYNNLGVAILVSKNLSFGSLHCVKDRQGICVVVRGVLLGKAVTFMDIY